MMILLTGTILARGRRTVTAALYQTGQQFDTHFSSFHQVLNRARWSPLQMSRHLLSLLLETFVQAGGGIDVVIDETLERRWEKIRPSGFHVLKRRRVVERTFACLSTWRRLSKDYEVLPSSEEAWMYIAMSRIMLRCLAQT